jgi:murein DD-endopeptidase MepM/ murein hydrolase activator NlpD
VTAPLVWLRARAGEILLLTAAAPPVAVAGEAPAAHVRPGTVVRWLGEGIESCTTGRESWPPLDGACYYPIDLLRGEGLVRLERTRGGRRERVRVEVGPYDYPTETLTLPTEQVDLSPENLARVDRENRDIGRLFSRRGPRRFTLPLQAPLDPLPEGGRFGSRRIINGRPRSPHSGADYSAPAGEPVLAAADGVVALVGDHFFGGNSVFVDHGDGLVSMYLHLSRASVELGQQVERGQPVGAVGDTGRATGPHLHFGLRWRAAKVDPAVLLGDPSGLVTLR